MLIFNTISNVVCGPPEHVSGKSADIITINEPTDSAIINADINLRGTPAATTNYCANHKVMFTLLTLLLICFPHSVQNMS